LRHIPDVLGLSRLGLTIPVFVFVLFNVPWAFLVATVLFALAGATDIFDGISARRLGVVSTWGVFLDLTADKVFVSALLIALLQVGMVPGWIVAIIVVRELVVTGVRSVAATKGTIVTPRHWGKQKTIITMVALGALLLAKGLGAHQLSLFPPRLMFNQHTLQGVEILLLSAEILLLVGVVWTILSGADYVISAFCLLRKRENQPSMGVNIAREHIIP
jgi:CDP-diacylglycerol---glycerol-3-phosphate 3-phosphatidyltransferase